MLKKSLAIILSLALVLFVAVGCSPKASADPNADKRAAAPIELKVTIPNPPGSDAANVMEEMKKEMEQKTDGKIKIKIYAGEALAKSPDMYPAVVNGLADIGKINAVQIPGILPLTQVTTLPMLGISNTVNAGKALNELIATNEAMQKEYKDVYLFGSSVIAKSVIGTNNKLIKTLADLKGMRIRVSPGAQTEFMKLAGAQPMDIPITETWVAMDKKTMDGYVFNFAAVYDYNLFDVTKYWTVVNLYSPTLFIAMNKAKFDSLPEDLKPIVKEVLTNTSINNSEFFDKITKDTINKLNAEFKDTIYILPADEAAKWQPLAEKAWQTWFDIKAKSGLNAKEVTDQFIKLLDKYQAR